MKLTVNGEIRELPGAATVGDVVADLGIEARGTAVAVNGDVAPRSRWSDWTLADGDRVEVLTVAQGG